MQRFQDILVWAPPGPTTAQLVKRAAVLAERNRARLTLLDVVPAIGQRRRYIDHDGVKIDVQEQVVESRRQELEELASGVLSVRARPVIEIGEPFANIVERVVRSQHDLVIAGPDRLPRRRGLVGATTSLHLLRKCPCPVWIDDDEAWGRPDVVVAVGPFPEDEQNDLNRTLLELGTSLARIQGGTAHVVHGWRLEGEHLLRQGRWRMADSEVDAIIADERLAAETTLEKLMQDVDYGDAEPRIHVRKGDPAEVISSVVDEVKPGVVVMGTLARVGLQGVLIGNTSERVLGTIESSVLAVKPSGFVTPLRVP